MYMYTHMYIHIYIYIYIYVHRELPRSSESMDLSRNTLNKEIGCTMAGSR